MLLIVFTLFNLQGTDTLSASQEAFGLYHTQIRLSRTFFVLFQTFSTGFSSLAALVSNLDILAQMISFVKNFFTFPFKFLHLFLDAHALTDSLRILSHTSSFVKDYFTKCDNFFVPSHNKERGLFSRPLPAISIIRYHQADRSRRRCVYRQPRRFRRYPHPGRRRNCGSADSSASLLPHGSWV